MQSGERVHEWVVDGPLGSGGMATVWRCHSVVCGRLKGALKIIEPRVHTSVRERFLREVDALAMLRHHGVVRVLSAGETDDGRLYLVMELLEGEDLLHRLQRGPMPWRDACVVFREVADGLRHAHAVGIHHRDLKPANVMLLPDGGGCLVDFGIALDLERSRLTRAGTVPGTVTYMAPELLTVDSSLVDPGPADVYGLGQVLCETLSGTRCFDSPQGAPGLVKLVRQKHAMQRLDPGSRQSEAMRDLVGRCTESDPLRRPTMAQVVRLLDAALSPDSTELAEIDERTKTMSIRSLQNAKTQWPFDVDVDDEKTADEEETLVLQVLQRAETKRLEAMDEELASVSDAIPRERTLEEPMLPINAVMEDEEVVQAFESKQILSELRAQQSRRLRTQAMVWGLAVVAAFSVGMVLLVVTLFAMVLLRT